MMLKNAYIFFLSIHGVRTKTKHEAYDHGKAAAAKEKIELGQTKIRLMVSSFGRVS